MSKTVMTVKFADIPGKKFKVKEAHEQQCGSKKGPQVCAFYNTDYCGLIRYRICRFGAKGHYFKEVLPK